MTPSSDPGANAMRKLGKGMERDIYIEREIKDDGR